ncbi:DDE-type integrase/transposase/recombinase [Caballeronia sp. EK]|uniref:DDE-type integrase/transposase/recombinase n=1 Tax=Caballeronia sp. EK TaxID=2767469 RepID=UPI002714E379|nr:DDE-type integrase/transposase/recombinase [Caballeronia sp. EK]
MILTSNLPSPVDETFGGTPRLPPRCSTAFCKKLTTVRREAEGLGWLDPTQPLPDDATIAGVFGRSPHLPHTCVSTAKPFREQIRDWAAAGVQGTTIHAALQRNHDHTGSYDAVKRMLRRLGAERKPGTTTTILEFPPSDAAQVDFGAGPVLTNESGLPLKTWIFVMTLCWSRHQYAEIVLDQTVETWLACHRRAFEWFGGCPGRVMFDFVASHKIYVLCPDSFCA